MTDDRDFLSRWSKRKAEARDGRLDDATEVDLAAREAEAKAEPVPAVEQDGTEPAEPEIPEELKDIDIDAMGYDADFTVFMKPGVPEALRRKALRRLWRSDPVLACLDGLNDYEEDFTDAAVAVQGLQSAYRIGKGYLLAENEETAPESDVEVAEAGGEGAPAEASDAGAQDEVAPDNASLDDPARARTEVADVEAETTDTDEKA